jgi:hypothetical protein
MGKRRTKFVTPEEYFSRENAQSQKQEDVKSVDILWQLRNYKQIQEEEKLKRDQEMLKLQEELNRQKEILRIEKEKQDQILREAEIKKWQEEKKKRDEILKKLEEERRSLKEQEWNTFLQNHNGESITAVCRRRSNRTDDFNVKECQWEYQFRVFQDNKFQSPVQKHFQLCFVVCSIPQFFNNFLEIKTLFYKRIVS